MYLVYQLVCGCLFYGLLEELFLPDSYMATGFYSQDSFLYTHNFSWLLRLLPGVQVGPGPGRGAQPG